MEMLFPASSTALVACNYPDIAVPLVVEVAPEASRKHLDKMVSAGVGIQPQLAAAAAAVTVAVVAVGTPPRGAEEVGDILPLPAAAVEGVGMGSHTQRTWCREVGLL